MTQEATAEGKRGPVARELLTESDEPYLPRELALETEAEILVNEIPVPFEDAVTADGGDQGVEGRR
jgi:hypothetical protein